MSLDIQHDTANSRFTADVDGGDAVVQYRRPTDDVLDLVSTFVPEAARNQDVGGTLVSHVLDWAASEGMQVVPSCPFVASYIEDHPEYQDLVSG
jgi:predicted GNAT family acetyltransferase